MADFEDLVYSVLCDVMKTFDASSRSARMKQSMYEIEGGADVGSKACRVVRHVVFCKVYQKAGIQGCYSVLSGVILVHIQRYRGYDCLLRMLIDMLNDLPR